MNLQDSNNDLITSSEVSLKTIFLKIGDWYAYMKSKWLIIGFFGIVGGVIGYSYAYFKKPIYTAATTFVLEEGGAGGGALGNLGGLASMVGIDVGGGSGGIFQGDNIVELYKSRKMIEKTLLTEVEVEGKKQLLIDLYIKMNKLRESWDQKASLKGINFGTPAGYNSTQKFTRLQDSVLGTIVNDINKNFLTVAKPDKKLSIIRVDVKSQDELFAKTFNDQIVINVNDFYIQTKTKKSLENVTILQQKTDSVVAVMNGAIYKSAVAIDATPNLNPTRQVQRIAPMQRSQFTAETSKALLAELLKNLELSKIALRKETPLVQVIDNPVMPLEKTMLGKLKGLITGGFLGGIFICAILIVRRAFKLILS